MKILRPGFFIRLAAFLTDKKIVCIRDELGKTCYTLSWINAFGERECNVFWLTKAGSCILHSDGSVTGQSSYIKKWTKM